MFRNPVQQALMVLSGGVLAAALVAGSLLHKEVAPNAGAAPNPVRFAYQNRIDDALAIIANEKKYFPAAGVSVTAEPYTSETTAELLFSGRVDLATMDIPTAVIAASRNLPVKIIAGLADNRPLEEGVENPPLLLLASDRILQQRPDTIRGLLACLRQAEIFIRGNPAEAAAYLSKATEQPRALVKESMARQDFRLHLDEPVLTGLKSSAEALLRQGIIDRTPDLRNMADAAYLP